jgi:formiminoglutamase
MHEDPNWPRASEWLAGLCNPVPSGQLAVLGAPLNRSISPGRCDLAPAAVRRALNRLSMYDIETNGDLAPLEVLDHRDLPIAALSPEEALEPIAEGVARALESSDAIVILGGDNGVTRAACHGLGVSLDRLGVVTLDAHLDLRDLGRGLHNGNPIRALLEDGVPGDHILQLGIQGFANSAAYAGVAWNAGIGVVTADDLHMRGAAQTFKLKLDQLAAKVDAIYFDLDVDVLDRAFAPACPGARPGGLTPWQVRQCAHIAGGHPKVIAMDLVEIDPEQDRNDLTALAAAQFLLAFATGMMSRI